MKQLTDEQGDVKVADAIRTGMTQADDDLPAANEPPEMRDAKELARRHYQKALALGAQPDSALERLLH